MYDLIIILSGQHMRYERRKTPKSLTKSVAIPYSNVGIMM